MMKIDWKLFNSFTLIIVANILNVYVVLDTFGLRELLEGLLGTVHCNSLFVVAFASSNLPLISLSLSAFLRFMSYFCFPFFLLDFDMDSGPS